MLELAAKGFYTHDTLQGFLLVGVVCGAMILWTLYVAWRNYGPPAKRGREQKRQ